MMNEYSVSRNLDEQSEREENGVASTSEHITTVTSKPIDLSRIWSKWRQNLSDQECKVVDLLFGIHSESSHTLEDVGDEIGVSKERVRQIKNQVLRKIKWVDWRYWQPVETAFEECAKAADYLISKEDWEQWLDAHAASSKDAPRPALFYLLCNLYSEFRYIGKYNVATLATITVDDLQRLESTLKRILRYHKKTGLFADELVSAVHNETLTMMSKQMLKTEFILKAVNIFERVGRLPDGKYHYLRKKKPLRYPSAKSAWAGKPDTQLFEWEQKLRQQFETVDWVGQLALTEDDFIVLCQAIQSEAQASNYFSGELEGQPRLVPPAVFLTTMVLSARFAEHIPEEAVDEFWTPYLRTVWNVEYSQAFYARCKKQFASAEQFLESTYRFTFPRIGASGEVVTPIFRHALIPRYMQADFAEWLSKYWRTLLVLADSPLQLAAHLKTDKSFDSGHYSHRLKHFVTGNATAETAATLISTMVTAIALHVNEGEPIDAIDNLLVGSPIEQELWQQLSRTLHINNSQTSTALRVSSPRVTWVWSLNDDEMVLRIQNVVIPAKNDLQGEVDRLVWTEEKTCDPLDAKIEVSVAPWRTPKGDRFIPDLFVAGEEGSQDGELILLTDMDEIALRLTIPSLPTESIQFFRLTQQGSYGIPVELSQVRDGSYLVCARQAVTFLEKDTDEDDTRVIAPDFEISVPYPLDEHYSWAAQVTLSLPLVIVQGQRRIEVVPPSTTQASTPRPRFVGKKSVENLSSHVQPTFATPQIELAFDNGTADFPKQTVLWLQGQDGWRWHQSFAALRQQGHLTETKDGLQINLEPFLPDKPNLYTVDLRVSLQSLLVAPLHFAIVPGLEVELLSSRLLYTPTTPFKLLLRGVENSVVVRKHQILVDAQDELSQQVTWLDYRHNPQLLLRFKNVEIPLSWSIPQFMAWLEPLPQKPYLTLQELRQTKLHVVSRYTDVSNFQLSVDEQGTRSFPLRRNSALIQLGQSQLNDMVKLSNEHRSVVDVSVQGIKWRLLEVRREPRLSAVCVSYEHGEQMVRIKTGLDEEWTGSVRFLVQSVTNPFEASKTLGAAQKLADIHQFVLSLTEGIYQLQIELDGAILPVDAKQLKFTVGTSEDIIESSQELIHAIRNGSLILPHLAEDFVLWWADVASKKEITLTPATRYQLATVPSEVFKNFAPTHLEELWPPLAKLREVSPSSVWAEKYGLLPAWIFLPTPLFFKTTGRENRLPVYPVEVLDGGYRGRGYGRWRLLPMEDAPKEFVYVQWRPAGEGKIQIEAGLPADRPDDWCAVELLVH